MIHAHKNNLPYAQKAFEDGIELGQQQADLFIIAYLKWELGKLLSATQSAEAQRHLHAAHALFDQMQMAHERDQVALLLSPEDAG